MMMIRTYLSLIIATVTKDLVTTQILRRGVDRAFQASVAGSILVCCYTLIGFNCSPAPASQERPFACSSAPKSAHT